MIRFEDLEPPDLLTQITTTGTCLALRKKTMLAGRQSDSTRSVTLLVGRRDDPTDGVRDYCRELMRACDDLGARVGMLEVTWASHGWGWALISLWRRLRAGRFEVAIVQVTHLAWSWRGFSLGMLLPIMVARLAGVRAGAMIHDPSGFGGSRPVDRLRRAVQHTSIKVLARLANPVFVSIEPSAVPWLTDYSEKAIRLVVGSNVGENANGVRPNREYAPLTVAVFGVTQGPRGAYERKVILEIARRTAAALDRVRVVAFGRGTEPEAGGWPDTPGVNVETHGLVPADKAAFLLSEADALVHVRGPVSSRRGAVAAAIAHALPVVGYRGTETGPPVTEAGAVLVEQGDLEGLASALIRIRKDPRFALQLRERSKMAWRHYFSWEAIARQFLEGVRCVQ